MKIPFTDLSAQHKEIESQIGMSLRRVLKRGDFILGEDLKNFEKEFALFCGAQFAVGVASGTDALFLALKSLGVKEGDEVIVPAFTYIATALAVSYTGAKPVFVDIEEHTYNIDIRKIRNALTKSTRAIIPVHLYGQPANMPEIMKIAKEANIKVIEDAAQAHGARIELKPGEWANTGAIGDIGCFSFYPTKNLGCMGDGGMVVTSNKSIYDELLMLRDYGRVSKYEHVMIGYNSRLDTLQAAVLRQKLKRLNSWNRLRAHAAELYCRYFRDIDEVCLPYSGANVRHVYHCFVIRVRGRDSVYEALKKNSIGAIVHYPIPLHLQKAYAALGYKNDDFPVSEMVAKDIISLPMFPHIRDSQIRYVVNCVKGALK